MSATTITQIRRLQGLPLTASELAEREADGLNVRLLWWRETGRVAVEVRDMRSGAAFEVEVGDDPALDVFHHPFAYATAEMAEDVCAARAKTSEDLG